MRGQEETLEGMAAGGDLAARPFGGFGDEHILVALRLGLDQLTRGWTADFLIGIDDDGGRQLERAGLDQGLQCGERDDGAALHVVDGGTEALVALAPDRQRAVERADGVDRVGVRDQQETCPLGSPGAPAAQDVTEPVAARQALDLEAKPADPGCDKTFHPIDGGGLVGRALDLDPLD